jgi:hypothetical protein
MIVLLQALLEYHCFPPPTPPGGPAALLRLFSGFWGSAAPRIGEQGARGWAYWCLWHSMGMEQPAAAAAAAADAAAAVEPLQEQDQGREVSQPLGRTTAEGGTTPPHTATNNSNMLSCDTCACKCLCKSYLVLHLQVLLWEVVGGWSAGVLGRLPQKDQDCCAGWRPGNAQLVVLSTA